MQVTIGDEQGGGPASQEEQEKEERRPEMDKMARRHFRRLSGLRHALEVTGRQSQESAGRTQSGGRLSVGCVPGGWKRAYSNVGGGTGMEGAKELGARIQPAAISTSQKSGGHDPGDCSGQG